MRFLARGAHLRVLQRHGLTHHTGGEVRHYRVSASADADTLADCQFWLLCCKCTDLNSMLEQIAPCVHKDAILITLQNGVRSGERTAAVFPNHPVVVGSAFIGARIEKPGTIIHSAAGHVSLASWQKANKTLIDPLVHIWEQAGTVVRWLEDGRLLLWRKMVWNCGFNAITALTRRYAREIVEDPQLSFVARTAMEELIAVAHAEGIALSHREIDTNMEITRSMGPVKTSAWQDVERGRPTEIDAINGEVVRVAEKHGIPVPVNRTLTALLTPPQHAGGLR